eukprot:6059164-Alexandrium_andersonii.AAC.1
MAESAAVCYIPYQEWLDGGVWVSAPPPQAEAGAETHEWWECCCALVQFGDYRHAPSPVTAAISAVVQGSKAEGHRAVEPLASGC